MKKLTTLVLLVLVCCFTCCALAENVTVEVWHPRGAGANGEMIAASVAEFNDTIGAEKGITVVETFQGGYGEVVTATMNAVAA